MAVRDDFTAGEVLAATDLNDTFASKVPYAYGTATPSTTVDGFVWYDENETPPALKFWDGAAFQLVSPPSGLVRVATESFSAVSSVSLNGVFTSAYQNYLLIINLTASTTINPLLRLRSAGTDSTGSYQSAQVHSTTGGTVSGPDLSGSVSGAFGPFCGGDGESVIHWNVSSPQANAFTNFSWLTSRSANPTLLESGVSRHRAASAYDGATLTTASANTITGIIRVYGYQNS
jgi:hypothetical protein